MVDATSSPRIHRAKPPRSLRPHGWGFPALSGISGSLSVLARTLRVMAQSPVGTSVPVIITDTGMLCGEVLSSCREGGKVTSLLWAIHNQGARLYLPRSIIAEIAGALERRAPDPETYTFAMTRLRSLYLPCAIVVDEVPESWAANDDRIQKLALRDPSDLPAARLGVAVGAFLLAEDPDLVDLGLGVHEWLTIAHAASNDAEYTLVSMAAGIPSAIAIELINGALRGLSRVPVTAQVAVVAALGMGGYWFVRNGQNCQAAKRTGAALSQFAEKVGPSIVEIVQRGLAAEASLGSGELAASPKPTVGELVAHVLARSGSHSAPLLAEDIARELSGPSLRQRTQIVRAELLSHPRTFMQVSRGRFALGRPLSTTGSCLPPHEVADFWRRSHRAADEKWRRCQDPWPFYPGDRR